MKDNLAKEDGLGYFNLARGIGILIILFGHSLTIFMVESKEGRFEGTDFKGDLRTGTYTFQSIEKGELDFE